MRILHLGTRDIQGGAARAAYRLHTGLRDLGHDSSMLVRWRSSMDPNIRAFAAPMDIPSRLRRRLRRELIRRENAPYLKRIPPGNDPVSEARSEYGNSLLEQIPAVDIVHLHWIAGFVDFTAFFPAVPAKTPVVWTLHDMNPFTGGCHYDGHCARYQQSCGACPYLGSKDEEDITRRTWVRKKSALRQVDPQRIRIVAPSQWLANEARRSSLFAPFPISVIPYGLDIERFAPRNSDFARDTVGLPRGLKVILFVADYVDNRRKGLPLLVQALSGMESGEEICLVSIGHAETDLRLPLKHVHLDFADNDRWLSLIYSAADVFVLPSMEENLGQTGLESFSCGTPVVAFDVGGNKDMIRPGMTGELVPAGDAGALRAAILDLLADGKKRAALSLECRKVAIQEFNLELQAKRYVELYHTFMP